MARSEQGGRCGHAEFKAFLRYREREQVEIGQHAEEHGETAQIKVEQRRRDNLTHRALHE